LATCNTNPTKNGTTTVDGSEIRRENQLRLVVFTVIYRVLYISQVVIAGILPESKSYFQTPTKNHPFF